MDLSSNMTRLILVSGVIVAGIVVFILVRPIFVDRDLVIEKRLEDEIVEKDREIQKLKRDNRELQDKVKALEVTVAELSVGNEDGLAIEEKRKALTEKENRLTEKEIRLNALSDELDKRESDVIALENASEQELEEKRQILEADRDQFIEDKQEELKNIGRAEQMEKAYNELLEQNNDLKEERRAAENRANNWLKAIYIGLIVIALVIIILITATLIYYFRNKQKDDIIIRQNDVIDEKDILIQSLNESRSLPPHQQLPEEEGEPDRPL